MTSALSDSKPVINKLATSSSRILMDIPCKVCNDHSSGKHYGIYACDGCAGFFKRSIRRNRQYICKGQSSHGKLCTVDKTHRNQCRACRLMKCTDAGMNKDAVQHERGPRNSTIRKQYAMYLRETTELASAISSSTPFRVPSLPSTMYLGVHGCTLDHFSPMSSPEIMNSMSSTPPPSSILPDSLLISNIAFANRMMTLQNSLPKFCAQDLLQSYLSSPEAVCEAAARLLFMNVRWMKSIPALMSLPYKDQITLLEESWRELFVLGACQFQMPLDCSSLLAHSGLNKLDSDNLKYIQAAADLRALNDLISKFKSMNVDSTEYSCLKGILTFKTAFESVSGEQKCLQDLNSIAALQDQAQLALSKYTTTVYLNQPSRFGKLLLMLPSLKLINTSTIEEIFFRKSIGSVPIERLLTDMYKSHEM